MKIFLGIITVAAVLGALAFFGLTPFKEIITHTFGTTTQGGTGSTARQFNVYGVNLAAPGANATTSAIQNTTGNDLFITAIKIGCEGVGTSQVQVAGGGLATLQITAATSTAATTVLGTNANSIGGGALVIGTSSNAFVFASSTSATPGSNSAKGYQIWPSGSFINFNTNATNTAVCTFGIDAFTS